MCQIFGQFVLSQSWDKSKSRLTMLMGSTGPILLTYTAVSITVGLTGKSQQNENNLTEIKIHKRVFTIITTITKIRIRIIMIKTNLKQTTFLNRSLSDQLSCLDVCKIHTYIQYKHTYMHKCGVSQLVVPTSGFIGSFPF